MKDESFTQSSNEREAAFDHLVAELPSESLNSPPERKRAIYDAFKSHYGLVPSEQCRLAKSRNANTPYAGTTIRWWWPACEGCST